MVHLGFLQQGEGTDARQRIATGQRLDIVVKVDQQTLAEARLDEAVGVSVKGRVHLQTIHVAQEVLREAVHCEVRHRAGLGCGHGGRITQDEDI